MAWQDLKMLISIINLQFSLLWRIEITEISFLNFLNASKCPPLHTCSHPNYLSKCPTFPLFSQMPSFSTICQFIPFFSLSEVRQWVFGGIMKIQEHLGKHIKTQVFQSFWLNWMKFHNVFLIWILPARKWGYHISSSFHIFSANIAESQQSKMVKKASK